MLGTLYRRIRNSSKPINEYSQQILSILTAGRVSEGYLDKSISKYVNAKDRGGLWKVSHDIFTMFSVIECHFQSETPGFTRKINCDSLVTTLLQDNYLLSLYSSVCGNANEKVKKEIALDLLEQIITLYVRIRAFSYAKDVVQNHKLASKTKKSRSLRTEIKKAASTLEQGH